MKNNNNTDQEFLNSLNESHYLFTEKIIINENINFHLEIMQFNNESFLTHFFKFNSGDMIYQTNLFLSKDLIDELENKVYWIINLKEELYYKSKTILFESINFKKYFDLINKEYIFLTSIFKDTDSFKYTLDIIQLLTWLNEEDSLDLELLDNYPNKEVYKNFQKKLKNNKKLIVDFYKITDQSKGVFYFIDWHIKSKNSYVNVRNKIPAAILFILTFFEYRNFSSWWYLELAENFESIINWENQWYLAGTWVSIDTILDKLDSYIKM